MILQILLYMIVQLVFLPHDMYQEEDCAADRIQSKRELLENLMPALKGLVLGTSQP